MDSRYSVRGTEASMGWNDHPEYGGPAPTWWSIALALGLIALAGWGMAQCSMAAHG
jgi:hypothetical protein